MHAVDFAFFFFGSEVLATTNPSLRLFFRFMVARNARASFPLKCARDSPEILQMLVDVFCEIYRTIHNKIHEKFINPPVWVKSKRGECHLSGAPLDAALQHVAEVVLGHLLARASARLPRPPDVPQQPEAVRRLFRTRGLQVPRATRGCVARGRGVLRALHLLLSERALPFLAAHGASERAAVQA